jgi:hypothetical protein
MQFETPVNQLDSRRPLLRCGNAYLAVQFSSRMTLNPFRSRAAMMSAA